MGAACSGGASASVPLLHAELPPRAAMNRPQDGKFNTKAEPLANQLINALEKEHVREVVEMFEEQAALRQELARVVDLMQTEMIPREQMLHDMFDKLNSTYAALTQDLHGKIGALSGKVSGVSGGHDKKRQELLDPLKDTQRELQRINQLLARPLTVPPDLPPSIAQKYGAGSPSQSQRISGNFRF